MKNSILFLLILVILMSVEAFAQDNKSDSLAIVTLLRNDYIALARSDIAAHRNNCTTDYLLIENGEVWNLDKEIEYMRSMAGFKTDRSDVFHFITMNISGSFAYVVYNLKSRISRNNEVKNYEWTESSVLIRDDASKTWKIKMIHSTKLIR